MENAPGSNSKGFKISETTGRIRSHSSSRPNAWDVMQSTGGVNARTQPGPGLINNNSWPRDLNSFGIETETQQTLSPLFEAFKKALEAQRQAINEPSVNQNSIATNVRRNKIITNGEWQGCLVYIQGNIEAVLRSMGLLEICEDFLKKEVASLRFMAEMHTLILEKKRSIGVIQNYFLSDFIIKFSKEIAATFVTDEQKQHLENIKRSLFKNISQEITFSFLQGIFFGVNERAFDMQFSTNEKDVEILFKATFYKIQSEKAITITDGKQIAKKTDEFIKKYIASKEASIRADISALNDTNLIEILNDIQKVLESIQLQDFLEYMDVEVNLH